MRLVLRQLFVRKHQLEIVHLIDSAAAGDQPGAEFDAPIKNIISDLDKRRNKPSCESPAEERYSHSTVSKGRIRGHCD